MIRHAYLHIAALLFAISAPCATAQENNVARLASNYLLADAVGERKCPLVLESKTSPGGLAITFERSVCALVFPFLAEVAAWQAAPAGGIYLVTAKGVAVTEFSEGVGGIYEAIRENDGVYFLSNLKVVDTREVQPADVVGEWSLSRPGGATICKLTLTNEAAGDNSLSARVAPGCDSAIAAFGPAAWQISSGDILLFSKTGETIRLGKNEEGIWARVPDQKNPRPRALLMTR